MPGPVAHYWVAREIASYFISQNKESLDQRAIGLFTGADNRDQYKGPGADTSRYRGISRYFFFGSVGPDVPYFVNVDISGLVHDTADTVIPSGLPDWKVLGKSEFADLFHYNKQGEFILQLVLAARKVRGDVERRALAYALGHATHLAVDSIVHSYVNCFAGIYHKQPIADLHRTSELHQDSWLARKAFGRWINSSGDSGQLGSWQAWVPPPDQQEMKDLFLLIYKAGRATFGRGPTVKYQKRAYNHFYKGILGIGYDKGLAGPPANPHESLVEHRLLGGSEQSSDEGPNFSGPPKIVYWLDVPSKDQIPWLPGGFNIGAWLLLQQRALTAAYRACRAVIELYKSDCSRKAQNRFRTRVKNWNMDTGYWIDVELKQGEPWIIWRHRWSDQKSPMEAGEKVPQPTKSVARRGKDTLDVLPTKVVLGIEVTPTAATNTGASIAIGPPVQGRSIYNAFEASKEFRRIDREDGLAQQKHLYFKKFDAEQIADSWVRVRAFKSGVLSSYNSKTGAVSFRDDLYPTEEMLAEIDVFYGPICLTGGGKKTFDSVKTKMKQTKEGLSRILVRITGGGCRVKSNGILTLSPSPQIEDLIIDNVVYVAKGKRRVQTRR
jgi:hypothetical protein